VNSGLEEWLNAENEAIRSARLEREFRSIRSRDGKRVELAKGGELVDFASNDYLGLANSESLKRAGIEAMERFGAGSGAARALSGNVAVFDALEGAIAEWKGLPASLGFSSGYAAAFGALTALLGRDDFVVFDKASHACLVDGVRSSGASFRVFPHNQLTGLEERLRWARSQLDATAGVGRLWIVTESVFSMDGDCAPLEDIAELASKYRASLFVDEAHACGVFGANGAGLIAACGLTNEVDVQMGTLGKALGSSGGFIAGSKALVHFLRHRARSFLFTTAASPSAPAAAKAAVEFLISSEGAATRERLWDRCRALADGVGLPLESAIFPVILGDELRALSVASSLLERGLWVPAIRYPTVRRGAARLRISVTADHSTADIERLVGALREVY